MAKATNPAQTLMQKAAALTEANIVKSRGGSGKMTYLDRIVDVLLVDNKPTAPKTRVAICAEVSLAIVLEQRESDIEQGIEGAEPFDLDNESDIAIFKAINLKVKPMVAAAVSNSNNSTALSYNDKYKAKWQIVKVGNTIALAAANVDADVETLEDNE